jgi:hypothetical protein
MENKQNEIQLFKVKILYKKKYHNQKKKIKNTNNQINKLYNKYKHLKEKLNNTYLLENNKQLEEENEKIKENNKQLEEENIKLLENNKQLEEENEEIKENNKQLEEENIKLLEDNKHLEEENEEIKENNKQLEEDLKDLKNNNIKLSQDLKSSNYNNIKLLQDNIKLLQDLKDLNNNNIKLLQDLKSSNYNNIKLLENNKHLEKDLKDLKSSNNNNNNNNKLLEDNIKLLEDNIKLLEDNIKLLEDKKKKDVNCDKLERKEDKLTLKGSLCSVNGNNYEKIIYNIVKNCYINNKLFNSQKENTLGGSSSKNDIECDFNNIKDIGIEIKKYNTPDWMQCSIKYDTKNNKWITSTRSKIPIKARDIFNKLITNVNIFNGKIPPFIHNQLTYEEWIKLKSKTNLWNDFYFDIPNDTIRKLYTEKGCQYIQISDGYGLYHLGNDICKFNVPIFNIEQCIRIRIKVHTKKNKKGFCVLSVMMACQPKNIKSLNKSCYSLDNLNKLPPKLIYKL